MARVAYDYGTSPRKLDDYPVKKPARKTRPSTKTSGGKKVKTRKRTNVNKRAKQAKRSKTKVVLYTILGFSMLFAISYRYSLINEQFRQTEKAQKQLQTIQKENEQLEISIENSLNINNIEKLAKERLGMQKLDKSQIVYVTLDKKDYVEAAVEPVVVNEEKNVFKNIMDKVLNFF